MQGYLNISEAVRSAVARGGPVVALESTVITHGLSYPANVETALKMEAAVRAGGALPATVAVLDGQITVGITPDEIERLGQAENVRKCSRRDFPIVVGLKQDGATTVAGTMIAAHMARIPIFATGGIGGVHRGHPFDVSADLVELGRTPVAVVCSGAKSILDLPLTLERLETEGVPVIGYGTDSLPAFYTRSSGLPVDQRVESAAEAGQIVKVARVMQSGHGVLITVPVPAAYELDGQQAEAAIRQAVQEADDQGVSGKAITPFVLARVVELTGEASRRANTALLENNARIAAEIAVEVMR